ncbi:MAG: T9SS type A sorting domain-containing protein [Crocinitomicaceae bacterium]
MFRLIFTLFGFTLLSFSTQAQTCQFQIMPTSTSVCAGDTVCVVSTGNISGTAIEQFDFNTPVVPAGWNIPGGAAYGQMCDTSLTGTDYYWSSSAGSSTPFVETNPMDVSNGGVVEFDLVFSIQGGLFPCEGPDLWDEGVFLQYSIDNGSTWVDIVYFNPLGTFSTTPGGIASGQTAFTSWGTYCFPIPPGAQTLTTKFRWIQVVSSGTNFDNWGLDEISIANYQPGTTVNWGNGISNLSSICFPVMSDTTITAFLINSLGDTVSQDQTTISVLPSYTLLDTVMVCSNDSVTFADGTVLTNITAQTTHTSSFQGVNSCDSTIITTAVPISTYSTSDTVIVCQNDDVTFADGTVFTNITAPTTYISSFQGINGCDSTITSTAVPIVIDTTATQTDSTITASYLGTGVTYAWLNCGNNFQVIPGETNQTYIPAQSGSYAVVLTLNGCSDTSSCFTIDNTANLNEIDQSNIKVYPNPISDHFIIDLGSLQNNVHIHVVDGVGRTVFTSKYESADAVHVELEGSAGLYFVELSVSNQRLVFVLSKE